MGTEDDTQGFRYLNRNFSTSNSEYSVTFSDCNSDRSCEFTAASCMTQHHRTLLEPFHSDDAIQSLISDLYSDSPDSQLKAAKELRFLAKHSSENRIRIARAGAVRPLVSLISSSDRQVQEQGVTAILNLSLCDENKGPIAAAGAIRALVSALKSGTPVAKENAACSILRLAQIEDLRAVIGPSGVIAPLVNLLETGSLRGKKDAATALYTLCSSAKENKERAVAAGIVRPLLDLMAEPESGMVDKAAYVLSTVATMPESRRMIVEEGGIPVLVEMLEVGTTRQKEVATDLLLQICEENGGFGAKVTGEGAVLPLIDLSQSGTSRAKKKAEALITLLRQSRSVSSS